MGNERASRFIQLLRSYPTLRAEDPLNAWAYVRSHRFEIEDEIRANENA